MYLFKADVTNISTEGIGQPVYTIPAELAERRAWADETWLIVNADRMKMSLPPSQLLAEFCRPNPEVACLQVWRID
jgi:hypothetical protein